MKAKADDRHKTGKNGRKRSKGSLDRGRIEKSAVDARQGEIVLGRNTRWILAACFVLFLLVVLILGPWW